MCDLVNNLLLVAKCSERIFENKTSHEPSQVGGTSRQCPLSKTKTSLLEECRALINTEGVQEESLTKE